jgi:hypothetical protein
MSSLTKCNACSLADIKRDAERRGATVEVQRIPISDTNDPMAGWYQVKESDRKKTSAWFMELTVECCC